nr:DUF3043 domain-containing protein [Nakamurella flavida]
MLRRKSEPEAAPVVETAVVEPTVGKGRPTPKRREAEGRRGPVPPPPMTQREAMKRSKVNTAGRKLTKDERRALAAERREKMMAGDDRFVLPRDRGPVRAYVRDLVDARRNVAGLVLPFALLSFVVILIPNALVSIYGPMLLFIALLVAILDFVFFSKKMARLVEAKFPKGDPAGLSTKGRALGFYGFNRAILFRKMRAPRPRVVPGQTID